MREYFTYGSVRGATGNGGPYRDPHGGREEDEGYSCIFKRPMPN